MNVGLEVTESAVRAVALSDEGEVMVRVASPVADGGTAGAIRETLLRVKRDARREISRAAVAVPLARLPSNDIVAAFAEIFPGVDPVTVSAGVATVIAESWCGAARGLQHVVTLAIGDHVTAGILINGTVWAGAHGFAGSVDWLALNPVERADYRRYGGLAAEVDAAGIVRRLIWRVKSGDHSNAVKLVDGDLTRLKVEHVFQAAREGDGVCISVMRDTVKYVSMAITNVVVVIDPEMVVLGGTLASAGEETLEAIRHECTRQLGPAQAERLHLVLSPLGLDAAAIGAARSAALRGE